MNADLDNIIFLILNYNSVSLTISCINSLLKLKSNLNVLVVDNNSSDNSFSKINSAFKENDNVKVILSKVNKGYASGNNIGLRYIKQNFSSKDYIVVMNPDILVKNIDVIQSMRSFLESHNDYSVVSTQFIYNETWRGFLDYGWMFPSNKNLFLSGTLLGKLFLKDVNDRYSQVNVLTEETYTTVDIVSGCFFMVRMDDLDQVDYFDERTFLYFEETILAAKLKRISKKEAILLKEFVSHNHQLKDKSLMNYSNRAFDRKCFHESKMIYINNYSELQGASLYFCNALNNIDFQIKKLIFNLLMFFKR